MPTAAELAARHCVPCTGGEPALGADAIASFAAAVPAWTVADGRLRRTFTFPGFVEAMQLVTAMALVAEAEQHHPDFAVHWNRVEVTIWTHAVHGLTDNDFILAARIDRLAPAEG